MPLALKIDTILSAQSSMSCKCIGNHYDEPNWNEYYRGIWFSRKGKNRYDFLRETVYTIKTVHVRQPVNITVNWIKMLSNIVYCIESTTCDAFADSMCCWSCVRHRTSNKNTKNSSWHYIVLLPPPPLLMAVLMLLLLLLLLSYGETHWSACTIVHIVLQPTTTHSDERIVIEWLYSDMSIFPHTTYGRINTYILTKNENSQTLGNMLSYNTEHFVKRLFKSSLLESW